MSNILRDARAYREHAGEIEKLSASGDVSHREKGIKVVSRSKDTLVLIDETGKTEVQTKGKTYTCRVPAGT